MAILLDQQPVEGTSVDLGTVWLNLASDLSEFMAFPYMSELSVTTEQAGEVRVNGSGRRRLILTPGRGATFALTLPGCSRDQVAWLEKHVSELMCVRDDRGRKVYGAYLSVDVSEWRAHPDLANVSLSLSEVTFSESA